MSFLFTARGYYLEMDGPPSERPNPQKLLHSEAEAGCEKRRGRRGERDRERRREGQRGGGRDRERRRERERGGGRDREEEGRREEEGGTETEALKRPQQGVTTQAQARAVCAVASEKTHLLPAADTWEGTDPDSEAQCPNRAGRLSAPIRHSAAVEGSQHTPKWKDASAPRWAHGGPRGADRASPTFAPGVLL